VGPNLALIYWGRRGFSRFTLEAVRTAREIGLTAYCSVSTSNEIYPEFQRLGGAVFPVATFQACAGALLGAARLVEIRRKLVDWLADRQVRLVITLMPHVWTPLISPAIKRRGMHYAAVIHDVKAHPGDPTGLVTSWLLTEARTADTVITLSRFVRDQLLARRVPAERIRTLFFPDLAFPAKPHTANRMRRRRPDQPLRILYFGRLLAYKGLPIFVETMEILAARGIPIELSVCGEGDLNGMASRLAQLGAMVVNRWLTDAEIGDLLACHDAAVLTHFEASQSGLISAALGAGIPIVTTPVGALPDQVRSRGAGLVADRVDAATIADCIERLALDWALYHRIVDQIRKSARFSMAQFLRELVGAIPLTKERMSLEPVGRVGDPVDATWSA
jgi:glycosyltransferase involved in cell wall biosynthesis